MASNPQVLSQLAKRINEATTVAIDAGKFVDEKAKVLSMEQRSHDERMKKLKEESQRPISLAHAAHAEALELHKKSISQIEKAKADLHAYIAAPEETTPESKSG